MSEENYDPTEFYDKHPELEVERCPFCKKVLLLKHKQYGENSIPCPYCPKHGFIYNDSEAYANAMKDVSVCPNCGAEGPFKYRALSEDKHTGAVTWACLVCNYTHEKKV